MGDEGILQFRILGPLEVVRGEDFLAFRGSRERAVLALLVLHANQTVSAERLAEDLWSGDPPEGAIHSLRVYVSRVRKALGSAADTVLTRPAGYLLQVDPAAVDALRFEELVARGRDEAKGGDHVGAAATLRDALALWRGPALADVADAPFAQAQAGRLEEARLAALEDRIEADLVCGRHGEVTAELEALTREHPFRERLWSQRIVALYRSGRQADALRAYQELRLTLGEQLGIEPSSALQRLEGAVLRHDPELDWHPDGTAGPPAVAASRPRPGPEALAPGGGGGGVVTFLFTDLVGSTELLDQLGEQAAEEARRMHFGLLREVVAAHGGTEVKSLGDGLMVAFASPLAALRGAVEIQETAARVSSRPGRPLAIRVGLHAGEPMRDQDDFHGTPVVVAKRLCDRADGGQILASVLVSDLVAIRNDEFAFRHLGPLPLKGFTAPVAACEVVRRAADSPPFDTADRSRLPQPLCNAERLPLVGRASELSRLNHIWEETHSGQRRLALLAGEPGIGKSRLSAEFARTVHGEGAVVLFGRCDEGMGVPYQPFVEALSRYLRQAPQVILGRLAGELVRLVPEVGERVHGLSPPLRSDAETERYRLFDAVAAWLGAASETAPVLFVIDDLHWATKPTLLLLSHLMRSDEDLRLLLLVTFRDTPLDMSADLSDLVAELLRQPGVERIRLPGLDESGVRTLMEAQAGHTLDDEGWALARIVHGGTAGNPFYVREMLRHLAEKGDITRRDGRWVTGHPLSELDVPDSVRDVVERRLTRLPDHTSEMLALAAVLGERFDLAVLVQASGETDSSVVETLRPAVGARLVEETDAGRYRFTHALLRSTLEDSLGPTRRQQLHRAAGLAVESVHASHLDAHLPELAHHFARARDSQRAIDYASRAGDRALAQLAHDEAVGYYRQALEFLEPAGDDSRRRELLIALGEAQRRAGDPAHRETLLEAARLAEAQGDVDALSRAALANHRGLWSAAGLVDADRVAVLEAALGAINHVDSAVRARLLANLALELMWAGDRERRVRLSDEALGIARRLDDPATLAHVLVNRFYAISAPGTLPERITEAAELLALSERLGDPVIAARAASVRFRAAMEAGDAVEADRCTELSERLAAELNQPTLRWVAMMHRAGRVLQAGRIGEADTLIHEALDLGRAAGQSDAVTLFPYQRFIIRFEQGRLADVVDEILDLRARVPGVAPVLSSTVALAWLELDELTKAREAFDGLAMSGFADIRLDLTWLVGMTNAAAVCARLGDTARAAVLSDLLVPYPDQMPVIAFGMAGGCVSHYLGMLASSLHRFDEADTRFDAAARTHIRIGAPTWLARTRLEWSRMLLKRRQPRDTERARELLGQALATAREFGLANVERQTVELLASQ